MLPKIEDQKLLIGARWKDSSSKSIFETINPYTKQPTCKVAEAQKEDIEDAVKEAQNAFEQGEWAKNPTLRAKILNNLASELESASEELASLESVDTGRPLSKIINIDIPLCIEIINYYTAVLKKLDQTATLPAIKQIAFEIREPLGVVGIITPWSFALVNLVLKAIPALATGNTVVHKPSSWTPLSALKFAKLCQKAGMPDGVYNITPGKGKIAGEALVDNPSVALVSFAGRQQTATQILKKTAQTLRKTLINTGGKSIHVVLPDCDLDAATYTIVSGIIFGNGQIATASSRVFVHSKIHEKFLDKLLARCRECKLGDPFDEQTTLGPLISKSHLSDALEFVEIAKKDGAKIALGGNAPETPWGYFINPTVLDRVTQTMKIFHMEIFAPILSVIVFDDIHKLSHLINKIISCYCLTIWTKNLDTAFLLSKEIRCANIWINTYNVLHPSIPFGSVSPSCVSKDLGIQSLDLYTYNKAILIDFS